MMDYVLHLVLSFGNWGLTMGMMLGGLLLLRPLLLRAVTPRQRTWLWMLGWYGTFLTSVFEVLSRFHLLPVTFRDLITPRTDMGAMPAYLPSEYWGAGEYALALPGGAAVAVELSDLVLLLLGLVWLAGVAAGAVWLWRRSRQVKALGRAGPPVGGGRPPDVRPGPAAGRPQCDGAAVPGAVLQLRVPQWGEAGRGAVRYDLPPGGAVPPAAGAGAAPRVEPHPPEPRLDEILGVRRPAPVLVEPHFVGGLPLLLPGSGVGLRRKDAGGSARARRSAGSTPGPCWNWRRGGSFGRCP